MKEIKCPSGAILKMGVIPFEDANRLKKVLAREIKGIKITSLQEIVEVCKNYLCAGISSDEVENCLWDCFKRCTYNNLKIDKQTFESVEARYDFTDIQLAVAEECLLPFGKSLSVALQRLLAMMTENSPK